MKNRGNKLLRIWKVSTLSVSLALGAGTAWANHGMELEELVFPELVKKELTKKWPGGLIEIRGPIRWTRGAPSSGALSKVMVQDVTPKGEALIQAVNSATGVVSEAWVSYAAWIRAHVATRRIFSGEKLGSAGLVPQDINVATGNAFEYRGVILASSTDVAGLEARQTILEGQFLTSTAVQKTPDVRRGDAVRIRLISGGLAVSTTGTAEEPGYLNGRIRVMSSRGKREFVGHLEQGGIVEVQL